MCQEQTKPSTSVRERHVHADLIIAWANGAEIQVIVGGEWRDISFPNWEERSAYRIKPKPPVKKYLWAYRYLGRLPAITTFYYEDEQAFTLGNGGKGYDWVERIEASCKEFPA